MIAILEYVDLEGRSPYAKWFNRLNAQAAAKVATALVRLEQGNLSGAKGVGAGVFEHRIDFGPATGSISARMAMRWSSSWAAGPRDVSGRISRPHGATGGTTGGAKRREG